MRKVQFMTPPYYVQIIATIHELDTLMMSFIDMLLRMLLDSYF